MNHTEAIFKSLEVICSVFFGAFRATAKYSRWNMKPVREFKLFLTRKFFSLSTQNAIKPFHDFELL